MRRCIACAKGDHQRCLGGACECIHEASARSEANLSSSSALLGPELREDEADWVLEQLLPVSNGLPDAKNIENVRSAMRGVIRARRSRQSQSSPLGPELRALVQYDRYRRHFRVRWKRLGGHYHCRVFSAENPAGTFAKLGDLVMDERDWESFQMLFGSLIQLLPEEQTLEELAPLDPRD